MSQWFVDNGYKNLPDFKQMVDELNGFKSGYAYDFYKHLSKFLHAVFENWDDYLDYEKDLRLRRPDDVSRRQVNSCFAATCLFQMRNIALVSAFDEFMESAELPYLEYAWALLYPILERYEKMNAIEG